MDNQNLSLIHILIGTLLDIGFTKEELVDTFQFTQSDVDDCVAETDDSGEV